MTENNHVFRVSDWVKGHSINDELFYGFVKKVNENLNTVKVYVTESDNRFTIGRTIETFQNKVKLFPITTIDKKGYLLNMVDLSLLTDDKDWFLELTDQLKQVTSAEEENCITS